jgi:hypothetical protein
MYLPGCLIRQSTALYNVVAYLMELQKEHPEKLVPAPEAEVVG